MLRLFVQNTIPISRSSIIENILILLTYPFLEFIAYCKGKCKKYYCT